MLRTATDDLIVLRLPPVEKTSVLADCYIVVRVRFAALPEHGRYNVPVRTATGDVFSPSIRVADDERETATDRQMRVEMNLRMNMHKNPGCPASAAVHLTYVQHVCAKPVPASSWLLLQHERLAVPAARPAAATCSCCGDALSILSQGLYT